MKEEHRFNLRLAKKWFYILLLLVFFSFHLQLRVRCRSFKLFDTVFRSVLLHFGSVQFPNSRWKFVWNKSLLFTMMPIDRALLLSMHEKEGMQQSKFFTVISKINYVLVQIQQTIKRGNNNFVYYFIFVKKKKTEKKKKKQRKYQPSTSLCRCVVILSLFFFY